MPYICIGLSAAAASQATAVTAMENAAVSEAYNDWQLTEEQWAVAPAIEEHQQDEKDESVEASGSKAEAASTKSTTE